MGRWAWSNRTTVEGCLKLDIKSLNQLGVFERGIDNLLSVTWSVGDTVKSSIGCMLKDIDKKLFLWLDYTITQRAIDKKNDVIYPIQLTTSECNFGGTRHWFICPLAVSGISCNRRVGTLYLPPNGEYFGCRHCYNLTYTSQKEHDKSDDAFRKLTMAQLMQSMDSSNLKVALGAVKESYRREKLWSK